MHKDIVNSGLSKIFGITNSVPENDPRAKFMGKRVRYKRNVCTKQHGQIIRQRDFIIKEVQNDYRGGPVLRGYALDRTTGNIVEDFGRCISIDDVVIVDD
jgi:hypothetical protein